MITIEDSAILTGIRSFFPVELQEPAITNLKLRLEEAFLQGQLSALQLVKKGKKCTSTT